MLLADIKWIDPTAVSPIAMLDHPNTAGWTVLIIKRASGTYDIFDYPSRMGAVGGFVRTLHKEHNHAPREWKNLNELEAQCVLYEVFK